MLKSKHFGLLSRVRGFKPRRGAGMETEGGLPLPLPLPFEVLPL